MEEYQNTPTPKKNNKVLVILLMIFVVLLAVAGGYYYYSYSTQKKAFNERTEKALGTETVKITPENILGNYSVRIESGNDVQHMTAYIDTDILGSYILHILGEYEPHTMMLEIDEEGRVYTNELGLGFMTYKASIDKTMIIFEKDGVTCKLTK